MGPAQAERTGGGRGQAAGALAALGYVALAIGAASGAPVLAGLGVAWGLGWLAWAWAWREAGRGAGPSTAAVWGWAVVFRLIGVGVTPTWEDDFNRYLWDGYQLAAHGNPYAEAPAAAFGRAGVPEAMQDVLDGINHPELPTVYGPAAQGVFGLAAVVAPGRLWGLKLGLIAIELAGWWCLARGRGLSARGLLLVLWCPLAVMELAFAGHPEALGVAAIAAALAADRRGWAWAVGGAVAVATKALAWVLAPFFLWRAGWRGGVALAVGVAGFYGPFWLQGSAAEWPALRAMGGTFEFNSLGFGVLQWAAGNDVARVAAPVLAGLGGAVIFGRWWCAGGGAEIPGAAVVGVGLLFSPVINPWYALWMLPFLALRPTGWGIGALAALPWSYVHGFHLPGRAGLGYQHPGWLRPVEAAIIATGAALGRRLKK